jgi:putative ABC transport system permease protein
MARALKEAPRPTRMLLEVDPLAEIRVIDALEERPAIAGVTRRDALTRSFRDTIAETVNITVGFYVLFASLCTVGVVYNAARIALSERARELASLRVLGFSRLEVGYILVGEMLLLTLVALPLGVLFGMALAESIMSSLESELYRMPFALANSSIAMASAVVLAAAILSALVVGRRLWRLDIVAALKTRE